MKTNKVHSGAHSIAPHRVDPNQKIKVLSSSLNAEQSVASVGDLSLSVSLMCEVANNPELVRAGSLSGKKKVVVEQEQIAARVQRRPR